MKKRKIIKKRGKIQLLLIIVTAIIIPIIISLFFYYGFHASLFGERPDIVVSISTVSIIPSFNEHINFTKSEDRGKIVKYLTENNIIPLTSWKTFTYYLGHNPEKNKDFCALHFYLDDDLKEEMLGKDFHYYYDALFKNEACINCLDGYIVVSNDANKKVDHVKLNVCVNTAYYFKKEDLSNLNFLSSHCVEFQENDLEHEESPATFKIYSNKEPPSFDIIKIYNPKSPDEKFGVGNYKLNDTRTRSSLFTITEGKYFLWNREFQIKSNKIFKFFTIIVPNCSE